MYSLHIHTFHSKSSHIFPFTLPNSFLFSITIIIFYTHIYTERDDTETEEERDREILLNLGSVAHM